MMRQTGGCAVGEISTRSRFFSRAILSASKGGMMPICSPSSPITRISRARIRSFVRIKRLSIQTSVQFQRLRIGKYSMSCRDSTESHRLLNRHIPAVSSKALVDELRSEALHHICRNVIFLKFLELEFDGARRLAFGV